MAGQQVIAAFGESRQEWASHTLEAQRFMDAGDSVVVFWHEEGRGLRSGVEVATDTAAIFTVREQRIVEVRGFMDRSAALEAVGLE